MLKLKFLLGALALVGAFGLGALFSPETRAQDGWPTPEWQKLKKEHRELHESAGEFEVEAKMWMSPEAPPQSFKATAKRTPCLNGFYIQEEFKCNFMGQAYEGRLLQGYDPVAEEYFSIWIDSMSPIMSISRGKRVDGKLVMKGTEPHPMTGKPIKSRSELETKKDKVVMEHFAEDGGTFRKTMELVYTRKK